jgi:hypothetical protein
MSKGHNCDVCGNWFEEISRQQKEEMDKLYALHDDVVLPKICDDCYCKYSVWVGKLSDEKKKEVLERYMRKKDEN